MKKNFVKNFTDLFLKFFDKIISPRIARILIKELKGVSMELNGVKGHYLQMQANSHPSSLIQNWEYRSEGVALRLGV